MNLVLFQHFVAVAEDLHFGRAAARVHVAQPQLSRSILRLEAELGVRLLDRGRNHVSLTAAGAAFLVEARLCIHHAALAARAAQRAAVPPLQHIRIGYMTNALHTVLPPALARFHAKWPRARITAEELLSSVQAERLLNRSLDLALLNSHVTEIPRDAVVRKLPKVRYIAAIPADWPEARLSTLSLADLRHRAFLLFPRQQGARVYEALVESCKKAGFEPNVIQENSRASATLASVRLGIGVGLISETEAVENTPGVVFRQVADLPDSVCSEVSLAWIPPLPSQAHAELVHELVTEMERYTVGQGPAY